MSLPKIAKEFFNRGERHMTTHPRLVFPIANPRGDGAERAMYEEWKAYFDWLGWAPVTFRYLATGYQAPRGFTAPCEFAADFDPAYEMHKSKSAGG
jgi:hypothetical protein